MNIFYIFVIGNIPSKRNSMLKTHKIHLSAILLLSFLCRSYAGATQQGEMPDYYQPQTIEDYASYDDSKWWTSFNDSLLDSLIAKGVENNYNVLMAAKRINIARYTLAQTRAGYYPQLDLNLGWTADRLSGTTASRYGAVTNQSYFNAGLSLSWEIDVFGRINAKAKENKAQIKVSRAEYEATMVSLQAQIASAYFQLRVYQKELEIARRHAEKELKVVNITEVRHQTGLASMVDVAQAKMVYYSTVATIPQLESSIHSSINSLAVLTAVEPQDLFPLLETPRELPDCRQIVPSAIPASSLLRRPDIAEARQNIEVAAAAVGIAKKDYLPVLSLTGSIGYESHEINELFKKNSLTYSLVPTLSWTLFEGLSRRAEVASARENMEIEIDNYNLTLMTAYEEADNALSAYLANLKYMSDIREVITYSDKADELSLDLYKRGLGTFTNVVDAQISLLEYENQLVEAQGNALSALVTLYKALGGGWAQDID